MRSATLRRMPPNRALPRMRNRLSGPRTIRRICGTIRPTKLMTPVKAVAHATISTLMWHRPLETPDIDAERGRLLFPDHQGIQGLRQDNGGHESPNGGRAHHENGPPVGAGECAEIPKDDGPGGWIARHVGQQSDAAHEERIDGPAR